MVLCPERAAATAVETPAANFRRRPKRECAAHLVCVARSSFSRPVVARLRTSLAKRAQQQRSRFVQRAKREETDDVERGADVVARSAVSVRRHTPPANARNSASPSGVPRPVHASQSAPARSAPFVPTTTDSHVAASPIAR